MLCTVFELFVCLTFPVYTCMHRPYLGEKKMGCYMWVVWDVTLCHWVCCSCHLNKRSAFMHMSSKQSYIVLGPLTKWYSILSWKTLILSCTAVQLQILHKYFCYKTYGLSIVCVCVCVCVRARARERSRCWVCAVDSGVCFQTQVIICLKKNFSTRKNINSCYNHWRGQLRDF
jgi:hypothetical protein